MLAIVQSPQMSWPTSESFRKNKDAILNLGENEKWETKNGLWEYSLQMVPLYIKQTKAFQCIASEGGLRRKQPWGKEKESEEM